MTKIALQLQQFQFKELFNELGWDGLNLSIEKEVSGQLYTLLPIAQKRGIQVLQCMPNADGAIPTYDIRQKIERKVTEDAREHLIIFTDANNSQQIWQWVSRVKGQTTQYREVRWQKEQSSNLLEQKLKSIAFDIDEEDSLTVFGVAERLRGGFDRDSVTKKFYKAFADQRNAFQQFIDGIPHNSEDQKWYTAVIIDRLMFLWFLQEKYFLDGNKRYLRNRLDSHLTSNNERSFYKSFLSPLFFRGFAEERTTANQIDIQKQFGNVPYLNGGLFAEHDLERKYGDAIEIPDNAFVTLFGFFDEWDWHLDERPLASGREINPDVLGYIFEKFVNQKQMGAYYTKEDITDYISKNTIIPCLFEKVRNEHQAIFDAHVWPLLKENPRRYVYPAMLHGLDEPYPKEVAVGLDTTQPNLLERRVEWNKTASDNHALPTEIWREAIARHFRTHEILAKLQNGEVNSIADLITYNLNITQFAQDVIERCTLAPLIKSFWFALAGQMPTSLNVEFKHGISVLDPTCGSGAFLFAALQILKPLYQAALTAMNGLLADETFSGKSLSNDLLEIQSIVKRFSANETDRVRDYAITKHIIVHNLYGVDIETQATEIAKLRLFLKLVALLDPGDNIEPLPDIDFNIRAGNTLVGYATADETEQAVSGMVNGKIVAQGQLLNDAWDEIKQRLDITAVAYNNFQVQQLQSGGHVNPLDKTQLKDRLYELDETLNHQLCRAYGKNPSKGAEYQEWKDSHKPFHWYVNFYPIMANGGFDVIIGNPPYVECSKSNENYSVIGMSTLSTNNLYALVSERAVKLTNKQSLLGLILPNSSVSAEKMEPLQKVFQYEKRFWVSNYAWRPSKLFDGANMLLAIWIIQPAKNTEGFTTRYHRWPGEFRDQLFSILKYYNATKYIAPFRVPKVPEQLMISILEKCYLKSKGQTLLSATKTNGHSLYYFRAVLYWFKVLIKPPVMQENGVQTSTSEMKELMFHNASERDAALILMASNLFSLHYVVWSSCQVVNSPDLMFPISLSNLVTESELRISDLAKNLMLDVQAKSKIQIRNYSSRGREFVMRKQYFFFKESKNIIDDIDQLLAKHFGFSEEEIDFVINYDIKYRVSQVTSEED